MWSYIVSPRGELRAAEVDASGVITAASDKIGLPDAMEHSPDDFPVRVDAELEGHWQVCEELQTVTVEKTWLRSQIALAFNYNPLLVALVVDLTDKQRIDAICSLTHSITEHVYNNAATMWRFHEWRKLNIDRREETE